MKLQIAFDSDLPSALAVLAKVHPYVDIVELGTPLIYREGMVAVRQVHQLYPAHRLLVDLKIMDAGEEEAAIAFEAGGDLVTVLGVTQDSTIEGVLKAAHRFGRQVMVDMMQVTDKVERGRSLLDMGCHYLCIHTAYDLQSTHTPLADLRDLRQELGVAPLAVAGGITLNTIDAVAALRPEIVIVGSAITRAVSPAEVAQAIRERLVS